MYIQLWPYTIRGTKSKYFASQHLYQAHSQVVLGFISFPSRLRILYVYIPGFELLIIPIYAIQNLNALLNVFVKTFGMAVTENIVKYEN